MDEEVIGFGLQVRETGRKSFTLDYMFEGRRRRLYIGDFPDWSTQAAREHAKLVKREIDQGIDPLAVRDERRKEELTAGGKFPAGYIHLPRGIDAEWVKQLVAEQLVTIKTKRGFKQARMAEAARTQRSARLPRLCPRRCLARRRRSVDRGDVARPRTTGRCDRKPGSRRHDGIGRGFREYRRHRAPLACSPRPAGVPVKLSELSR